MKSFGLFLVLSVAGDNRDCPDEAIRDVKRDGKAMFPGVFLDLSPRLPSRLPALTRTSRSDSSRWLSIHQRTSNSVHWRISKIGDDFDARPRRNERSRPLRVKVCEIFTLRVNSVHTGQTNERLMSRSDSDQPTK